MGKRQFTDGVQEPKAGVDEKTSSEVQGSGRTIFTLVNIVFNLIDDEMEISDVQKKNSVKQYQITGERPVRMVTGAINKLSKHKALLGSPDIWCWFPGECHCPGDGC